MEALPDTKQPDVSCAVIPSNAPAVYGVVNRYLLPLAVPLLLFSADLR